VSQQVFENRFDVPVDYAFAWLTDFRPDDMRRLGQDPRMPDFAVVRKDGRIVRDWDMMGMRFHTETTLESPTRWTTKSTITRKGKLVATGDVVETLEPAPGGTLHRAVVRRHAESFFGSLVGPFFDVGNKSSLRKVFANAKKELEAAYRAGKAPTA
jgi:hypothetical protein